MPEPTDDPAESFDDLIARVRLGDKDAIGRLVSRYESQVRLTARLMIGPLLRPLIDSADLTQSAHRTILLRLQKEKLDLQNPEQLVGLLVTIVRRKVAAQGRRLQREKGHGRRDAPINEISSLACTQPNPANTAAVNDAVARLMVGLPEVDRRMLELRLEGCSTAQVALELRLDARVLRARLSRLRKRLRDQGILSEWL